jgi:hypothetical protein
LGIALAGAFVLQAPALLAQGVAFQPVVGALPVGPSLGVTPVVSADRRYVRLSLNAQFIDNAAFNTFMVPGAVSGGPSGPGALGGVGLGGIGGLGGGGGGGGRVGGQFLAGMNGVIDPSVGFGMGAMPADPYLANTSAYSYSGMYPSAMGAMPPGAGLPRAGLPRAGVSKTLKRTRAKAPKGKAAAPAASPSSPPVVAKKAEPGGK